MARLLNVVIGFLENLKPKRERCPIWTNHSAESHTLDNGVRRVTSPRAGVTYDISDQGIDLVSRLSTVGRTRLTTLLVDQAISGVSYPQVSPEAIAQVETKASLQMQERADRLLRYIAMKTDANAEYRNSNNRGFISRIAGIEPDIIYPSVSSRTFAAYAWTESSLWEDVLNIRDHLENNGLIDRMEYELSNENRTIVRWRVSVEGHNRIADLGTERVYTQGFVAMWIHESTNDAFVNGIKPAIEMAGYKDLRIDQKPDVNKIDDEIISEIRRSRFVVADFTHGDDGARGGVYFEAGLAYAYDIPVIYTCRKDLFKFVHFDTRQLYHIVWETPEQLRDELEKRIVTLVGQGPLQSDAKD